MTGSTHPKRGLPRRSAPDAPLPRAFYLRPALTVARELLGCVLVRRIGKKKLAVRIVEVEAYTETDPASHTFRGRTPRNEVMFRAGGHLYVYFTYGMHFCMNVVTGPEGRGEAVLLRAGEPLEGVEEMRRRRRKEGYLLTNGPAKLAQALGVGRSGNGADLTGPPVVILPGARLPASAVLRSSRIGISAGKERKWRFAIRGNPWVSR